ncbi:MAG TPA: ExeM/NucH family extracellular endonuclease [Thermoanaerobaculia bacterium]|nr:ExeM/NucH family extracellular endonuclease [Thermoanaerobaculia bacterium]
MRLARRLSFLLLAGFIGCLLASPILAQVSLTTIGTASTQNFDTLATSGTANTWTDNSTLPGWYAQFSATPANPTTYRADSGGANTGAIYSWGVAGVNPLTERAFGMLSSGTPVTVLTAVRLVNNTGVTISSLDISYNGEQWRDGGAVTPVAQTTFFEYQVANAGTITDANTPTTGWTAFSSLNITSPTFTNTGAGAALDGNAAANRIAKSASLLVTVSPGQEIWLRWRDINDTGNDHGMGVDDFSVTPQGGVVTPTLNISDVTLAEGDPPGTTTFTFAVTLTAPAGPSGVTFDIATADNTAQDDNPAVTEDNDYVAQSLTGQTIPSGSTGPYNFSVTVNRDTTAEPNETFFVNVTNITGANAGDTQGQGTINNDDVAVVFIHDVQGNGAATPLPGATVTVEGVVTANFQGTGKLQGFFLEEEDADFDADPATSEGIFIFCSSCPTAVAEGQRVKATGTVSEFNNMTEISATTAPSVVVTDAGNHLAEVTPAPIDLPVAGVVNDFYEAREGMLVTFVDTLTVSEYFELARYGQIVLFEGSRPRQFTEDNPPSVAGNNAHADDLNRRRVILDDDNDTQEWYLSSSTPPGPADGSQFVFHPRANGGFSVGTQGIDFLRGGDLVGGLTGVLHWDAPGFGAQTWRIRPTNAHPVTFTATNLRPATPPAVGGAIKAAGMNLLNYFTTIDTTASTSSGPCAPAMTADCRGADSVAELNRQRERASIVICAINADVFAFMELENTTPSATITDLLGAVNTSCGGAHPYAFVNTGGTLGTDAIRVQLIYRTGIVSPVGSPLVDLDPVHNRPPTAQTFDVVDATNPAFGERFTVVANHLKSKGCPGTGGDADLGDGQGCFNATRVAQATRTLTWITGTVLPAAGDPDVLLLGDFNSYASEDPVTTLEAGGYSDLETVFHGTNAYSYLFSGELGHLDYAFASASLGSQVTGADAWHINADEAPLFDYNDEVKDVGEATFDEKPDGSALVPPRVVFQPMSPYRAADHDPVIVGLFEVADLSITKTDGVTTAVPGGSVTYTITASNAGPDPVTGGTVADTFPAVLTCTWTCVGAGGGTCTAAGAGNINDTVNLPVGGSVTYTASCTIAASATGTLANTATVSGGAVNDPDPANNSATDTDTLTPQADLAVTKTDGVTTAIPGGSVTYTITASNAGPSDAPGSTVSDVSAPALTCTWTCVGAGSGTCTASGSGVPNDTVDLPAGGSVTYTASCTISSSATFIQINTATVTAPGGVTDPDPSNNTEADSDLLSGLLVDLSITKTDGVTSVTAGGSVTYTIVASNSGPDSVTGATVSDTFPASLTCTWTCAGAGGGTCTASGSGNINDTVNLPATASVTYTASCTLSPSATGTLTNMATVAALNVGEPNLGNNSATDSDTVTPANGAGATVSGTKTASGTFAPGSTVTYTVVLTNSGPGSQGDNPGDEFTDVLPAGLTLVDATATSGTAVATVATNTVTWNGAIAAVGSVTITIHAIITAGTGTTITNQGTFAYDADGNGTNETSGVTDDPGAGGAADPTSFQVGQQAIGEIPTLDTLGLALLALLLALGGAWRLRKKRA